MAGDPKVTVKILGDTKGLQGALDSSSKRMSGWAKGVIGVVGGAFAVGQIAEWSGAILETGTQIENWRNKTNTVFEDSAQAVRDWASESAGAMGLTDEELSGLAANFGDLLKPMGFTSDAAANLAQETLDLSGALSAWTGGQTSAAEVSEILSKAMLGERDQLKSLGIAINQAEVDQRALAIAQAEGRDAVTQMDKALATQQLILEKSTDAQTAWADGSQDSIKAQNEWKATIAELKEEFVVGLFPILQGVVEFLVSDVIPVVNKIIDVWGEKGFSGVMRLVASSVRDAWPSIRSALGQMLDSLISWVGEMAPKVAAQLVEWGKAFVEWVEPQIKPALEELGGLIGDLLVWLLEDGLPMAIEALAEFALAFVEWVAPMIPPLLLELGKMLLSIVGWVLTELVPAAVSGMADVAGAFLDWIADEVLPALPGKLASFLSAFGSWVVDSAVPAIVGFGVGMGIGFVNAIASGIGSVLGGLADTAASVGNTIWNAFKEGLNSVIRAWNSIEFSLPSIDMGPLGSFGGWTLGTPDIPEFHSGGVFRAPRAGGEGLAMLRDGERIIPAGAASAGGGAGITIVNHGVLSSEQELARMIDRARRHGTVGAGRL